MAPARGIRSGPFPTPGASGRRVCSRCLFWSRRPFRFLFRCTECSRVRGYREGGGGAPHLAARILERREAARPAAWKPALPPSRGLAPHLLGENRGRPGEVQRLGVTMHRDRPCPVARPENVPSDGL